MAENREQECPVVWALAGWADCASPDHADSPGADFLRSVWVDTVDRLADDPDVSEDDAHDMAHEVADNAPSIYTYRKWQQFVDLAAWQESEEVTGNFGPEDDIDRMASMCLYVIALRLAETIIADHITARDETDDDDDETETDA